MTTAVAAAIADGSPARTNTGGAVSADKYLGTWTVPAAAGTPWPDGGTLTITPGSKASLEPYRTNPFGTQAQCLGSDPPDPDDPHPSAYYTLKYTWKGGGTMGGCVSDKTRGLVYFGPRTIYGSAVVLSDGRLGASWTDDPSGRITAGFYATKGATGGPATPTKPAARGRARTVPEPQPGGAVEIASPQPLPACPGSSFRAPAAVRATCAVDLTVRSSGGDLKGTTVVGEDDLVVANVNRPGEAVAACWLAGPDALTYTNKDIASALKNPALIAKINRLDPDEALLLCMYLVLEEGRRHMSRHVSSVSAAAATCPVRRFTLAVHVKNKRLSDPRLVKSPPTATSVRYTCKLSGGTMAVHVSTTGKAGLRGALGTKLDLGVVRSQTAPKRAGKLTFSFNW